MARVEVLLYGALARVAGKRVEVEASTLQGILDALTARFGDAFEERLLDDRGALRRFVNIYVNGRDVRFLKRLETELGEGDTVSVIPAVSGG